MSGEIDTLLRRESYDFIEQRLSEAAAELNVLVTAGEAPPDTEQVIKDLRFRLGYACEHYFEGGS